MSLNQESKQIKFVGTKNNTFLQANTYNEAVYESMWKLRARIETNSAYWEFFTKNVWRS